MKMVIIKTKMITKNEPIRIECSLCKSLNDDINYAFICNKCEQYEELPDVAFRKNGEIYIRDDELILWDGKRIRILCHHFKERCKCKICKGTSICEHYKEICKCKICNLDGYLSYLVKCRIYSALKKYSPNVPKQKNHFEYLGCDLLTLRKHLEKQFTNGMSWSNYGDEWYIKRIKPCNSFTLTEEDERLKCFNYTNLQPLWHSDKKLKTP